VPALEALFAPPDQLVGGAGHGRNYHGDFMPSINLALDVKRDVADAVDIGDRRSAEFHDETRHTLGFRLLDFRPRDANAPASRTGAKGAYSYRRGPPSAI